MFILKRQDVEITSIQHPTKDQKIPILQYQSQTFRLISVFNAAQEEDARAFWRDLTDNRGKACVLLEEPDRYSVWGKVRLEQLADTTSEQLGATDTVAPLFIQACVLILQAIYLDIEDLLGVKQAKLFEKEIIEVFHRWHFPQTDSPAAVNNLLEIDPLTNLQQIPPWQEHHLNTLLQELHRLGKSHFGNTNFTERVLETLDDMPAEDQAQFVNWLKQSPNSKLWR
ncbi:MAG: hypothetical protein F6K19_01860 [Cyanothece sp. SIO1E1]|nr:hypothetical protein [Cyanothece sp. SIO1E1]